MTHRKNKHNKKRRDRTKREPINIGYLTIKEQTKIIEKILSDMALDLRENRIEEFERKKKELLENRDYYKVQLHKVLSNPGARSKGVSETKPETNEDYEKMIDKIKYYANNPKEYKARPLVRHDIPKPKGGTRPLSVPCYEDRLMQSSFTPFLNIGYEEIAEPSSFGFRPLRSPQMAGLVVAQTIIRRQGMGCPKYALCVDISKYFDSILMSFIMENICDLDINGTKISMIPKEIMEQWLTCGYVKVNDFNKVTPTGIGVPQGGIISPVIANLVLHGLDNIYKKAVEEYYNTLPPIPKPILKNASFDFYYKNEYVFTAGPKMKNPEILEIIKNHRFDMGFNKSYISRLKNEDKSFHGWTAKQRGGTDKDDYIRKCNIRKNESWVELNRFADDITVLCNSTKAIDIFIEVFEKFGKPRGISLNMDKTIVKTLPDETFDYLGFTFKTEIKKKRHYVYFYPPMSKEHNLYNRIDKILNKYKSPENCITKLNMLLRGWLYYYSYSNSKDIFIRIQHVLWRKMFYYFYRLCMKLPGMKTGRKASYKKRLAHYIRKTYTCEHKNHRYWFYIDKSMRKHPRFKNRRDLYLINPAVIEVKPVMITIYREESKKKKSTEEKKSLSAFHPKDSLTLRKTALDFKPGIYNSLLKKSNGRCSLCQKDLLELNTKFDIHHKTPSNIDPDKFFHKDNIIPLCIRCHRYVTDAVNSKNIKVINELIMNDILSFEGYGHLIDPNNPNLHETNPFLEQIGPD
jgi:group II intron reverse transcriptase/maturase